MFLKVHFLISWQNEIVLYFQIVLFPNIFHMSFYQISFSLRIQHIHYYLFLLLILCVCAYCYTDSQQDDDEYRLVKDLFTKGYNKNVRPVEDKNLPVEVKFGIAYTQVVDLVGSGYIFYLAVIKGKTKGKQNIHILATSLEQSVCI